MKISASRDRYDICSRILREMIILSPQNPIHHQRYTRSPLLQFSDKTHADAVVKEIRAIFSRSNFFQHVLSSDDSYL